MDPGENIDSSLEQGECEIGPAPGAETLFRNLYRVHLALSAIADNKANFLISVNSIILVLSAAHAGEVVTSGILLFPAALVLCSCIGSMIFAVLAARPRINRIKAFGQLKNPNPNLLFFGTFSGIVKGDYVDSLTAMSKDSEAMYRAMSADIYDVGIILEKKFRRLQIAYGFLLYGLPGGIFVFLVMQTILSLLGQEG